MLGDMGPSVADLQAVWPFDWLLHEEFKGEALPEDGVVNAKSYPRVFAWLKRYKEVLERARERASKLRGSQRGGGAGGAWESALGGAGDGC